MKQILLVDDDFLSLNAFYALADWGRYGLRIAYEAHNGREALAYLELCEAQPDVAFIDVCMPEMDGIELLQNLRSRYPKILCIMLSSYSDFPYVRETLKLGAADYLLKHEISPESVVKLLAQYGLCSAGEARGDDPEQRLLAALLGHAAGGLRGHLLYAAYQGERPLIEAQQRSILQTCRHILNGVAGASACAPSAGELVLLLPCAEGQDSAKSAANASQKAQLLQKALLKYHNARFTFSPPRYCPDASHIQGAYKLLGRLQSAACKPRSFLATRESALLTLAVVDGQKAIIGQTLHTLFENISPDNALKELCNNLLALLSRARQTLGLPTEGAPDVPRVPAQAEAFFLRRFTELCDQSSSRAARRFSQSIREAIDYMNLHYAEDIHLGDVAQHCHLSYNHLSFLFKKETGDNIISYLNRIRVYHAGHLLLLGGASVSSACQQAGFKGYNHFVTTFKTITGMTPSEFKKSPAAVDWMLKFSPAGMGKG